MKTLYVAVWCNNGKWQPCLPTTRDEANQQRLDIIRGGRKCYVYKYSDYLAIGGPDNE